MLRIAYSGSMGCGKDTAGEINTLIPNTVHIKFAEHHMNTLKYINLTLIQGFLDTFE